MLRRRGRARIIGGRWTEQDLIGQASSPETAGAHLQQLLPRISAFEPGDHLIVPPGFGTPTRTDLPALAFAQAGAGGLLSTRFDPVFRESLLHAGVPLLTLRSTAAIQEGDDLIVTFDAGTIEDVSQRKMMVADELRPAELELIRMTPTLALYGLHRGPQDPDVVEVHPSCRLDTAPPQPISTPPPRP